MRTKILVLCAVVAAVLFLTIGMPTTTEPVPASAPPNRPPNPPEVLDSIPSYALRVIRPAPVVTPYMLMTNLVPFEANLVPNTPPR